MSEPKTVRVRIAVGVHVEGAWSCHGNECSTDEDGRGALGEYWQAIHYVEANVPLPEPATIEGEVTE